MNHRIRIFFSVLLIAVFSLFNVGLPVVQYLCPMMSAENPTCAMMPSDASGIPLYAGTAITNVIPSCCSKYIIAERNTTPFLKIQDAVSHADGVVFISSFVPADLATTDQSFGSPNSGSVSPPSPLFILHSSLLI